ncbi:DUF4138 domain-containing protein [Algoriphagus sp.]|uniref:DUF4138 domain-containing protein n=1 Tax=Algoriphagus sp. TaxID=1872435 RepID=UPI00260AF260|nr:DUF4138 domain-containing protein [Algoriphagus sp.]
MRKFQVQTRILFLLFGLLGGGACWAQQAELEVSWDKTTVLIFDAPIQSIDRGSPWLLGQKDERALNLLKLKAGSKEMPNTNLHVLTSDGRIHAFEVRYAVNPVNTTWDFREEQDSGPELESSLGMNSGEFEKVAEGLALLHSNPIKKQFRYEVHFWLKGIYYQQGLLFFDLMMRNTSRIPFEPLGPDLRVVDSRSSKRSSRRVVDLEPAFSAVQSLNQKDDQQLKSLVLAYPVFTVANQKHLVFRLRERRGDRELHLRLKGKHLLQAQSLPIETKKPI